MQQDTQTGLIGHIEQKSVNVFDAPEFVIPSPQIANAVWQSYRQSHFNRIILYAEIDGLVGGNPPYNPEELRAAGLQHVSNFNDMSAGAVIDRACLAYWNLLYSAMNLVTFVIRLEDPEAPNAAKIMSEEWTEVVVECWPSFLVNLAALMTQLVKLGISPAFFPDERDPRWRVIQLNRFYVPDQAQSDIDMMTSWAVETEYTLQYLWQVYKEFKDADKDSTPWDTDELGRLLVQLSNGNTQNSNNVRDVADFERRMLDGDVSYSNFYSDKIRLVSLFQKEYDGKITHMMFYPHFLEGSNTFLFREEQYDSVQDALVLFTMNPGSYTIHGNRGVGHKIFSLAQAKIQADCSLVDMIKFSSTPIIKSSSSNTGDIDQIKFFPGVPTNIGSAEFVDSNLGSNINNVVGGVEYLSRLIQFNLTYSGSDPASPDPDSGSISPSQARLMAFQEFGVLKNNIQHFYSVADRLFQNMTVKILESKEGDPGHIMLKKWKERCLAKGVPEEMFATSDKAEYGAGMPKHLKVTATRAAGHGSQVGLLIALQELNPFVGTFGPREEKEFMRLLITATLGSEFIPAFMQESDDVDEVAGGASLAGVENAIIQMGKSPIFSKDNAHRSHFAVHMALMTQVVQLANQQQMDAVAADAIFTVAVPHIGEHLQALSQSVFSQQFYSEAKPQYDQLVRYATLNKKNAEKVAQAQIKKEQEDQAATDQVMQDNQRKDFELMNDERRKDTKQDAQIARQDDSSKEKQRIQSEASKAEIDRKAYETRAKAQLEKSGKQLEAKVNSEIEEDPQAYLQEKSGESISPYDLE